MFGTLFKALPKVAPFVVVAPMAAVIKLSSNNSEISLTTSLDSSKGRSVSEESLELFKEKTKPNLVESELSPQEAPKAPETIPSVAASTDAEDKGTKGQQESSKQANQESQQGSTSGATDVNGGKTNENDQQGTVTPSVTKPPKVTTSSSSGSTGFWSLFSSAGEGLKNVGSSSLTGLSDLAGSLDSKVSELLKKGKQ